MADANSTADRRMEGKRYRMSTQRYISTSFWEDKWIRSLDPSERYLYMYFLTNPLTNIAGAYKITIDRIAFDTGYDERTLRPMIQRFEKSKKAYFYSDEWIILPSWPKHQKWEIKKTIKKGIEAILYGIPDNVKRYMVSIGYLYPIEGYEYSPSYSDSDSDIDLDIDADSGKKSSVSKKQEAKHEYGSEKNVLLTDAQYSKLVADLGEAMALACIEELSQSKAMKGYKYKRDDLAIRKWVIDAVKKKGVPPQAIPDPKHIDLILCPVCETNERPTVRGCCTKCGFFLDPSWINDPEIVEEQKAAWLKASANA